MEVYSSLSFSRCEYVELQCRAPDCDFSMMADGKEEGLLIVTRTVSPLYLPCRHHIVPTYEPPPT